MAPGGRARLVMRARGNLRLLLNGNLWPEMKVTLMDGGKARLFPFQAPGEITSSPCTCDRDHPVRTANACGCWHSSVAFSSRG